MLMGTRAENHTHGAPLSGRVEVADHVLFASPNGDEWCVVINGATVDHLPNRSAALDLISRLGSALRAGLVAAPACHSLWR
jgi:hypothetical protein